MATIRSTTGATLNATTTRTPGALVRLIALTGFIMGTVGTLDFLVFFYLTQRESPIAVFQYVASGLFGPSVFAGGYATALLGLLLHYAITYIIATVFIVGVSQVSFLARSKWVFLAGLVYGIACNMIISMVVLPLSAAPKMTPTTALIVNGMLADALFVGVPVAYAVWRHARASKAAA